MKRISLELGGNAPLIIFEDADLEKAVTQTAIDKYRNNGQTCICANRIFVHFKIYEAFIQEFKSHVKRFYIADPFDQKAEIFPVLHPASIDKVEAQKMMPSPKVHGPFFLNLNTTNHEFWQM